MPCRRELATIWSDMLAEGLPAPVVLVERRVKLPVGSREVACRNHLPADLRLAGWGRTA